MTHLPTPPPPPEKQWNFCYIKENKHIRSIVGWNTNFLTWNIWFPADDITSFFHNSGKPYILLASCFRGLYWIFPFILKRVLEQTNHCAGLAVCLDLQVIHKDHDFIVIFKIIRERGQAKRTEYFFQSMGLAQGWLYPKMMLKALCRTWDVWCECRS